MTHEELLKKLNNPDTPFLRHWLGEVQKAEEARNQLKEARIQQEQEYQASLEVQRKVRLRQDMHANSPEYFMKAEGFFLFDPRGRISSQELYALYCRWCGEQQLLPHPQRAFLLFVRRNAANYNILHSCNIPMPGGKHVNGYLGIRCLTAQEQESRG